MIREEHPRLESLPLLGVIKEVAPTAKVKTDEELGVTAFQKEYFNDSPLYLDAELSFYKALGSRNLSPFWTWNPFKLWKSFKQMNARIKEKNIEGNMAGEGVTLGGVLVLGPGEQGIVHTYLEKTGRAPEEWVPAVKDAVLSQP